MVVNGKRNSRLNLLGDAISLLKKKIIYFEDENIDSDEAKALEMKNYVG